MSSRRIDRDPVAARQAEYRKMEEGGESQEAIWEALALIRDTGLDIGPKADAALDKRSDIKAKRPKKK